MRARWIVWSAVTGLFAAYVLAGWASSRSVTTPITLVRGKTAEITLKRIVGGPLQAELTFAGKHTQRPELGEWSTSDDAQPTGFLRFAQPGAQVRIEASFEGKAPILLEAMPKSSYGTDHVGRNLTSNLAVEPGLWRWPPPDAPRSRLGPGVTRVRFDVVAVDDRLNGETVGLTVRSPLGFKSCEGEVCWLWFWFLWPILAALQACWAGILVLVSRRSRARENRAGRRATAMAAGSPAGEDDA